MRCTPAIIIGILCLIAEIEPSVAAAESPPGGGAAWTFRDGDRVALIGGTFIEREQRYGYLETALTLANPDKTITFRNLGWSGDTLDGVSRSGFDPPEAGFKQLIDQVLAVKPTVIVVGYGANESFNGKAGLDAFTKGLERLIDALKSTKARFIFLAPLKQEDMGRPLPDPAMHNRDVKLYSQAIEEFAGRKGATFVTLDPFTARGSSPSPIHLTDNGVHLTAFGHWKLADCLELKMRTSMQYSQSKKGPGEPAKKVSISYEQFIGKFSAKVSEFAMTPQGLRFTFVEGFLPSPPAPGDASAAEKGDEYPRRTIRFGGIEPGLYTLRIDGKPLATATDAEWAKGISLDGGPEVDQVEKLRETIVKKNELFFHRWRPQNITYLLGFRKHEQGNNAVELAQFDPLVAEQEQKINELKKPVPHVYELTRDDAKGGAR